ncbi:signal peptidase I [Leucobacter sp. 7(1)]|uniref:signal peptidase I n=1 Tax=Leucobacter sp. 7(1) TaxID=1255613 RepID=UPI000B3593A8|nr:signal peptidase I [Leucobacter sp. 7(1)]
MFVRTYRVARSVVLNVAAALGLISILVFTASLVYDVRPHNVISGSMEPGIPTGSLLVTRPISGPEIQVGDVITTPRPSGDGLVTHRVREITELESDAGVYEMTMRGDANTSDDPRPYTIRDAHITLFHIPLLGFGASLLQTRAGVLIGIAIACVLLLFFLFPGQARDHIPDPDPDPALKLFRQ